MIQLGLSVFYYDSVALVIDDKVICAIEWYKANKHLYNPNSTL